MYKQKRSAIGIEPDPAKATKRFRIQALALIMIRIRNHRENSATGGVTGKSRGGQVHTTQRRKHVIMIQIH